MARRAFDFKTDLRVELLIPNPGIFILGQSVLDGTDVLGGDTDTATWTDTLAEVVSIETTQGLDLSVGTLCNVAPSHATIVLRTNTYDPNINRAVHVGTQIRVSVLAYAGISNAWDTIFQGKITGYDTSYNFDDTNLITFNCDDILLDVINTQIPAFNTPSNPSPITEAITALAAYAPDGVINTFGTPWVYTPQYALTDTTFGNVLADVLDTEIGAAFLDTETQQLNFYTYQINKSNSTALNDPLSVYPVIFSTVHPATYEDTHYCISDIVFSSTANDAVNEIIAVQSSTGIKKTKTNTDSVDLYGRMTLDVNVNASSTNILQLWLDRLSVKYDVRKIKSISFRMLDEKYQFRTGRTPNAWFMNNAKVIFNKGAVEIEENYLITRVQHFISPTSWDTTLELWKGL